MKDGPDGRWGKRKGERMERRMRRRRRRDDDDDDEGDDGGEWTDRQTEPGLLVAAKTQRKKCRQQVETVARGKGR